ncbi:hypothetical protein V6N12_003385 [Hibiscus sabdariffa]|uniref:Uncharacterized protein n=1 Tax=Hibiscus sabdariffa TaxID=183260 RepID=A0ABR2B5B2_9ROSI
MSQWKFIVTKSQANMTFVDGRARAQSATASMASFSHKRPEHDLCHWRTGFHRVGHRRKHNAKMERKWGSKNQRMEGKRKENKEGW